MLFDIHVHTTLSACSCLTLNEILENAGRLGLQGVCITDHQTMAVRRRLREGVQPNGLCVLFGMEYSTPQGDFLLFGPHDNLPAGLSAGELMRLVRQSAGVAVAAHPCRLSRPLDERLLRSGYRPIIETLNGRSTAAENAAAADLAARHGLTTTCGGSDAHALQELGRFTTRFSAPIRSRSDLIQALQGGKGRPVAMSDTSLALAV